MTYNKNLIKFNLKSTKEPNVLSQIFLTYVNKNERLRYYIRKRIEPKYWDVKTQRVKASHPNYRSFNILLTSLSNYLEEEINKMIIQEESISIENLRALLDERLDNEENEEPKENIRDFLSYYEEFIKSSLNLRKESTLKYHRSTRDRLKQFSELNKRNLFFEDFDKKFENQFRDYLINKFGLANNTVSRYFKSIKVVLNWSVEKGYNNNLEFRKFRNRYSEGEIYFLTWDELMKLYCLEIPDFKLQKVRDIFCFGCFTGLRFSDLINLKQENISNDMIEISTLKTSSKTRIPLNRYSREIYERYTSDETYNLFSKISNQKMNDYLKELGELAGINSSVSIFHYSGTKRTEQIVPKYKVLTSHMARKTFITNALAKGMSTEVIMEITTQKSYKVFQRYFKIVDEHKKEQMSKVFG